MEVSADITDDLDVFAAFGYVDNKFIDSVNATGDFTGNESPLSPNITASAGGAYRFEDFDFSGRVSYTGEQEADIQNTASRRIDSRFIVDASIGYVAENWEISLFARNILDNDYITFTNTNGTIQVGEPRVVGVSGRLNF